MSQGDIHEPPGWPDVAPRGEGALPYGEGLSRVEILLWILALSEGDDQKEYPQAKLWAILAQTRQLPHLLELAEEEREYRWSWLEQLPEIAKLKTSLERHRRLLKHIYKEREFTQMVTPVYFTQRMSSNWEYMSFARLVRWLTKHYLA